MILSKKSIKEISFDHYILYLMIAYAFILPISRAGISILTAILSLMWLFDKNLKERFLSLLNIKVIVALFAFIGVLILSLIWSTNLEEGLHTLRRYWYLLIILPFVSYIKASDIAKIISAFLLGMAISEIISYGVFFELWSTKHSSPNDPTPFMNHLQYSMFLAFVSLLLLNRVFFSQNNLHKIGYFLYFLFTTSNLFINGGRTGQVAFIVGIVTVGLLNIKHKLLAVGVIIVLSIAIFSSAYQFSHVFQARANQTFSTIKKFTSQNDNRFQTSFGARVASWTVATKLLQDNPILGTGLGSEMDALKEKIDTKNIKLFKHPLIYNIVNYHNDYISYTVSVGVVGLILYLSIFITIAMLKIQNREINNLKYIFIAVFMTSTMFEQMFSAQFPIALFALFSGIFISSSITRNNTDEKN
ncbi:MAG TPA: O-antigen ligase family protein [Sulfurimonas autotrophica]|nr:O-antigen ligase family protein [Sulfurimonas autotrophica]